MKLLKGYGRECRARLARAKRRVDLLYVVASPADDEHTLRIQRCSREHMRKGLSG